MNDRPRGLYEVLITEAIASWLRGLGDDLHAIRDGVRPAEAPDRLALHLGRIVQRAIAGVKDADRVAVGVALARKLIDQIDQTISGSEVGSEAPIEPGTVLRAVLGRTPDGRVESMPEPLIPLLDTTLLTNAPGEPRVGNQLLTELHSADRIDLVMAFIRRSGIAPLLDTLRSHCQSNRELRVLTTTYTGSTEGRALDALHDLGADIRVSYDMSTTRLHAKAWLFHRRSGFSTAYIGSSNLTYSAQISGLEWNVRVSGARNPDVIDKVAAVFESYWNSGDFIPYDAVTFAAETARSASGPVVFFSPIELRPEPFQERLLEQIAFARERGHHRNLLVSATGTGKTVMAVRAELLDLIEVLATRVDHVQQALITHPDVPLQIHARYSRIEILAAFGVGEDAKVAPWQAGVYWAKDAGADLFAFTLDKTTGQFSPTTRYRDYAVSPDLIHWESQSSTRADSETGRRYQKHEALGSAIMLFARLRSDDRAFWFLGPARYVKHESELPMAIIWRLEHSLPGDLFAQFAAAVA